MGLTLRSSCSHWRQVSLHGSYRHLKISLDLMIIPAGSMSTWVPQNFCPTKVGFIHCLNVSVWTLAAKVYMCQNVAVFLCTERWRFLKSCSLFTVLIKWWSLTFTKRLIMTKCRLQRFSLGQGIVISPVADMVLLIVFKPWETHEKARITSEICRPYETCKRVFWDDRDWDCIEYKKGIDLSD